MGGLLLFFLKSDIVFDFRRFITAVRHQPVCLPYEIFKEIGTEMRKRIFIFRFLLIQLINIFLPATTYACSVCYGDPGSPLTIALRWSVLFLLTVLLAVLGCFVKFFLQIRKKEMLFNANTNDIKDIFNVGTPR